MITRVVVSSVFTTLLSSLLFFIVQTTHYSTQVVNLTTLPKTVCGTLPNPRHRRDLRDAVATKPDTTFLDVRAMAVRWSADDDDYVGDAVAAVVQVPSPQAPPAPSAATPPELANLLSTLIGKMDQLLQGPPPGQASGQQRFNNNRRFNFTGTCWGCGKVGHMRRQCQSPQGNDKSQS